MSSLIVTERRVAKLDAEKNELEKMISKNIEKRLSIIKNCLVVCGHCEKKSKLFSWVFIQNWWWIQPSGCTEGGYWKEHKTETCYIVCPRCNEEIYLYNYPERDRIVKLISVPYSPRGVFQ